MTIPQMLDKYSERFDECDKEWSLTSKKLCDKIHPPTQEESKLLTERIQALNIQLGTYECIIKDLTEYLENETSR